MEAREYRWLRYTRFQPSSTVLRVIWGCYKSRYVLLVLFAGCLSESPNINIRMRTAFDIIVSWLEKRREIMFPLLFTSPREATIKLAAMLAMVSHKASYMHHTRSIRCDQGEEYLRMYFALKRRIPDRYSFPLESGKMPKTRKQE